MSDPRLATIRRIYFLKVLARAIQVLVFGAAIILSIITYTVHNENPRTDDAPVTANVVGVAPRVSGMIRKIGVSDNQFVKAGELLFEIDPAPYLYAEEKAEAQAEQAQDTLNRLEPLLPKHFATPEQVDEARTTVKADGAALESAKYDLASCRVVAPFDGYISNLNISSGAFAHAGTEVITMVDTRVWYVIADFRESTLRHIAPGMRAEVFIMSQPNIKYLGHVQGVGKGVRPQEVQQLSGLPQVKPELNWVRLAERFPVRIQLDASPEDDALRDGVSAIVTIRGK